MTFLEYFRSVEHVWLLWLAGVSALVWLTRKAISRQSLTGWKVLLAEEDGAAYTLSFVMTMPIYLLFIALVVETSLFLIVKIGTAEAAYATARSHVVWASFGKEKAEQKRKQAAVNAMAAFASSSSVHAKGAGISGAPPAEAGYYYDAYRIYTHGQGPAGKQYLVAKYRYAARATKVDVRESQGLDGDVNVKVTYEMPFQLPVIGRFIGHKAPWPGAHFYTITIVTYATLPNEAPRNAEKKLGIDYAPN